MSNEEKINDMFTKGGYIRADGLMIHDMIHYAGRVPAGIQISLGLLQGRQGDERRGSFRPDHRVLSARAEVAIRRRSCGAILEPT
jgi:hypothetical protein